MIEVDHGHRPGARERLDPPSAAAPELVDLIKNSLALVGVEDRLLIAYQHHGPPEGDVWIAQHQLRDQLFGAAMPTERAMVFRPEPLPKLGFDRLLDIIAAVAPDQ